MYFLNTSSNYNLRTHSERRFKTYEIILLNYNLMENFVSKSALCSGNFFHNFTFK